MIQWAVAIAGAALGYAASDQYPVVSTFVGLVVGYVVAVAAWSGPRRLWLSKRLDDWFERRRQQRERREGERAGERMRKWRPSLRRFTRRDR